MSHRGGRRGTDKVGRLMSPRTHRLSLSRNETKRTETTGGKTRERSGNENGGRRTGGRSGKRYNSRLRKRMVRGKEPSEVSTGRRVVPSVNNIL